MDWIWDGRWEEGGKRKRKAVPPPRYPISAFPKHAYYSQLARNVDLKTLEEGAVVVVVDFRYPNYGFPVRRMAGREPGSYECVGSTR